MRNLILAGGGHAHVYVLKKLRKISLKPIQITLISPTKYQYYSGMFAGFIEGLYDINEIRINLDQLCKSAGIRFIEEKVTTLSAEEQYVITDRGKKIKYDLISFNLGSNLKLDIPGVVEQACLIKPNYLIHSVQSMINKTEGKIVVVGGGASAVEMSLSIQSYRRKRGSKIPVSLISSKGLLEQVSPHVSRKMVKLVERKGIEWLGHNPVVKVDENRLLLQSGQWIQFDKLIWLTGPSAPELFRNHNLDVDSKGFLKVNEFLQAVNHPNLLGAGDCITLTSHPELDKAGVYAVREAPVLWNNIQACLNGQPLKSYHPQSTYLSIISTGDKQALLLYKNISIHGKWSWWLKNAIDRSFIKSFSW